MREPEKQLIVVHVAQYLDFNSKMNLKLSCKSFRKIAILSPLQVFKDLNMRLCLFIYHLRLLFQFNNINVIHVPSFRHIWVSFHHDRKFFNINDQKTILIDRVTGFVYSHPKSSIISSLLKQDCFECVDYFNQKFTPNISKNEIFVMACIVDPFFKWWNKQNNEHQKKALIYNDIKKLVNVCCLDPSVDFYFQFFKNLKSCIDSDPIISRTKLFSHNNDKIDDIFIYPKS